MEGLRDGGTERRRDDERERERERGREGGTERRRDEERVSRREGEPERGKTFSQPGRRQELIPLYPITKTHSEPQK